MKVHGKNIASSLLDATFDNIAEVTEPQTPGWRFLLFRNVLAKPLLRSYFPYANSNNVRTSWHTWHKLKHGSWWELVFCHVTFLVFASGIWNCTVIDQNQIRTHWSKNGKLHILVLCWISIASTALDDVTSFYSFFTNEIGSIAHMQQSSSTVSIRSVQLITTWSFELF